MRNKSPAFLQKVSDDVFTCISGVKENAVAEDSSDM